jgi:glycosyltransferase involved in cell wall biosynthesis
VKILHLSSERSWRGGEQQIAYLIDGLKAFGCESIVAVREKSVFHDYCLKNEIAHFPLGFRSELDIITALKIKRIALENKVDIVHLHTGKGHGIGVLSSCMGMDLPMVLSKRTDFPIKDNFFSRYKFNFSGIKKILCVSKKIKEIIDADLIDSNRSVTVYSGIDLKKFKFEKKFFFHQLFDLPVHIKLVGNTSAIADQKDYFTFVRTAKEVSKKRDDVRFLIIGSGPMENEIREFVRELKMEKIVLFTGFLTNLPEVLFNLDVFLITSKTEGLGTSILDAHACGLPVVGTDAGGIGEVVIDGKTGSLCLIGDEKSLAEKVLSRLQDHELFDSQSFVQKFSKENTAKMTFDVYQQIK